MKKLLFLLLSLAVAVSASAGVDQARTVRKLMPKVQAKTSYVEKTAKKASVVNPSRPMTASFRAPAKVDIPAGYVAITLEAHDVWGEDDDSGYQILFDADATAYGNEIPTTGGAFDASNYGAFEYKIPENADGNLDTQNIVWDGSETILIPAGTYDFVILNPSPGSQIWIASNYGNIGGRVDDFTFVEGNEYHFLLALGSNGNDYTTLTIIEPGKALTTPENLTVAPGDIFANVNWDDNDDLAWNLRWRPWKDTEGASGVLWDFPVDDLGWLSEWLTVDADGDGNSWDPTYLDSESTNAGWYSESWASGTGSLDPDNWLISPEVALNGTLSFTLGGVPSYPDHMGVFAIFDWDSSTGYAPAESDLIEVGDFYCSGTDTEITVTADLSQFNGRVGRLIFRHYNSYDCYHLYIDNIQIGEVIEPYPWNYVNDLEVTEYTIEGLTPETKYEVQVQAAGSADASAWTDIVEFTTLPLTPDVYILGEVGEKTWDPTDGLKMEYNAEDNIYTATVTFDGRGQSGENYFSFTTELAENNDDGGWTYIAPFRFGAVSEGDFWYDDQYDGQPLDLTYENYQAFRIMAGEYKLTVDLANMKLIIEKQAPEVMIGDVNMDGKVNIADVTALIDYLLSNDASLISLPNSNINGDTNINIADVTALIDMLLTN